MMTCASMVLALALFLSPLPSAAAGLPPPVSLPADGAASLAGHLEMLADPQGTTGFGHLLAGRAPASFVPLPGFLNRGYTTGATWLRFRVGPVPGERDELFLRLGPPLLDELDVYVQAEGDPSDPASYVPYRMGDHRSATRRPVPDTAFDVPVPVPPPEGRLVYVRVRTSSAHTFTGELLTVERTVAAAGRSAALKGGWVGVALAVGLINLVSAASLRERLFAWYAFYVFCQLGSHFGTFGLLATLWPEAPLPVNDYFTGVGAGLTLATFCAFATVLFDTRRRGGFSRAFFTSCVVPGVAAAAAVPAGLYVRIAPAVMLAGLAVVAWTTVLGVRLVLDREPAGKLFLTAFLVSNATGVVRFGQLLSLLPATGVSDYVFPAGVAVNMVLMTLALTARVRFAEERAIASSREAEQRAVELAEGMTRELREGKAELERALERQLRFVDVISHEYRTPVAILSANLDILRMKEGEAGGRDAAVIEKMRRAVARLVEVFDVSFGRSRLDERCMAVSAPARIALAPFLGEILEEARGLWPDRRFELSADGAAETAGDPAQLKTAFLNLLDNAVKYSPIPRPIRVVAGPDGEGVSVAVEDEGPGVAEEELGKLFEKFYRGHGSAGTRGAGLGLFLVRRIVEGHGGSVSLVNRPDEGARVTVRLPGRGRSHG